MDVQDYLECLAIDIIHYSHAIAVLLYPYSALDQYQALLSEADISLEIEY